MSQTSAATATGSAARAEALLLSYAQAGYIHARATRGWRGARSAWLSIIGFAAVIFNFTIVNMFFKGLHAYSGL